MIAATGEIVEKAEHRFPLVDQAVGVRVEPDGESERLLEGVVTVVGEDAHRVDDVGQPGETGIDQQLPVVLGPPDRVDPVVGVARAGYQGEGDIRDGGAELIEGGQRAHRRPDGRRREHGRVVFGREHERRFEDEVLDVRGTGPHVDLKSVAAAQVGVGP